jgi:hypothetical protein
MDKTESTPRMKEFFLKLSTCGLDRLIEAESSPIKYDQFG